MLTLGILAAGNLVACSGDPVGVEPTVGATPPTPTNTPPVSTTDTGQKPTGPLELHGTVPAVALAAPVFTEVVNLDVTLRSQADLIGHPTVMWFYPAAGTGG